MFLIFYHIYIYICFTILYWFCHTSTRICHGCTHASCPEPPSYLPPHIIPLGHPSAPAPSWSHIFKMISLSILLKTWNHLVGSLNFLLLHLNSPPVVLSLSLRLAQVLVRHFKSPSTRNLISLFALYFMLLWINFCSLAFPTVDFKKLHNMRLVSLSFMWGKMRTAAWETALQIALRKCSKETGQYIWLTKANIFGFGEVRAHTVKHIFFAEIFASYEEQ